MPGEPVPRRQVERPVPLAAAKRELAEEGDLAASDWAVLADFFTTPGGSDEAIRSRSALTWAAADRMAGPIVAWVALPLSWVTDSYSFSVIQATRSRSTPTLGRPSSSRRRWGRPSRGGG